MLRLPLPQRHASTLASIAITCALIGPAAPSLAAQKVAPPGPATLTAHQRIGREIYQQLVEINTVDSVGSVTKAVYAMAARFRAAGFPAEDIQILVPAGKPTKGNLVVRYHGRGGPAARKPSLFLCLGLKRQRRMPK